MSAINEHHAYLSFDELSGCAQLFERQIEKIVVDLCGRTTLTKSKTKSSELGIKRLSHTYLDVEKIELEIHNVVELKTIQEKYTMEGCNNVWISRMIVHWKNGDMQEWNRHIFHIKDKELIRNFPSGRMNALTMKLGTYQQVEGLRGLYGDDAVKATICQIVKIEAHDKRVCLGTMAETA